MREGARVGDVAEEGVWGEVGRAGGDDAVRGGGTWWGEW